MGCGGFLTVGFFGRLDFDLVGFLRGFSTLD